MSEINVTPLVDVMLVLLIIFMITAPLMQQGIEVALPQTSTQPLDSKEERKPIIVTITKDQVIKIGQVIIPLAQFEDKLKHNEKIRREKEVYLEADRTLCYGLIVDVMARMKRAGIEEVGLMTEEPPLENRE
jgi:biopolymer transport protein TolR